MKNVGLFRAASLWSEIQRLDNSELVSPCYSEGFVKGLSLKKRVVSLMSLTVAHRVSQGERLIVSSIREWLCCAVMSVEKCCSMSCCADGLNHSSANNSKRRRGLLEGAQRPKATFHTTALPSGWVKNSYLLEGLRKLL